MNLYAWLRPNRTVRLLVAAFREFRTAPRGRSPWRIYRGWSA